jgi:hypothetical protein
VYRENNLNELFRAFFWAIKELRGVFFPSSWKRREPELPWNREDFQH